MLEIEAELMSTHLIVLEKEYLAGSALTERSITRFLMCPPRLYDVNYVINPWMAGNLHAASRELAGTQWQMLYEAVTAVAEVELIDPEPGSPDMVFTANAGLVFLDEFQGRQVAISSFFHVERQAEEPHFRRWFSENGYTIRDTPRETPFEGEGDALYSQDGKRLWVGFGPRTFESSHEGLRRAGGVDVVGLELIDPRFYHLDTCFAPLEGGYILYYPMAFASDSLQRIEAYYPAEKRIAVEEADAVQFACNAVNVGRTIILNLIGDELRTRLEARGFQVVQVDLSEFLRAGGAAKCLVMKL